MFIDTTQFIFPRLSPSSHIRKMGESVAGPYQFSFRVHEPSGALLFLPESDVGFLEVVRGAKHHEPEGHIDKCIRHILGAFSRSGGNLENAKMWGLSDKDFSLLKALASATGREHSVLFPKLHCLEVEDRLAASIQKRHDFDADLIVVRHLLEHVRDVEQFVRALRHLLRSDGICFIEVPDSTRMLSSGDITQLWEEHCAYFTPTTLSNLFELNGFEVLDLECLESDGEDLCLLVVRVKGDEHKSVPPAKSDSLEGRFLTQLPKFVEELSSSVAAFSEENDIWIYGANHMAGVFLDIVAGSRLRIRGVIDDDPVKSHGLISSMNVEIHPYETLLTQRSFHLLVAISEGRVPELYSRLSRDFRDSQRHHVQSLATFAEQVWEKSL